MTMKVGIVIDLDERGAVRGGRRAKKAVHDVGKEADKARRPLHRLEGAGRKAGKGLSSLGTAAAAAVPNLGNMGTASLGLTGGMGGLATGATAAAAAIAKAGDAYRLTEARITALTGSVDAARETMASIYDIAIQDGVAIDTLNDVTARFTLALNDLGYGQQAVLGLTESIVKLGALGGASTTEFNAAAIQLSQGLASGELRGEELRSVMEQLPLVAQTLAKELGVTIGELREMAFEGELTGDIVTDALLKNLPKIREDFESLPKTMSRAWEGLKAVIDQRLVQLDKTFGLASKIANLLDYTTDAIRLPTIEEQIAEHKKLRAELDVLDSRNRTGKAGARDQQQIQRLREDIERLSSIIAAANYQNVAERFYKGQKELGKEIESLTKKAPEKPESVYLKELRTIEAEERNAIQQAERNAQTLARLDEELRQRGVALLDQYDQQRDAVLTLTATQTAEYERLGMLDEARKKQLESLKKAQLAAIDAEQQKRLTEERNRAFEQAEAKRAEDLANATDWASGLIRAQQSVRDAANDHASQMENLYINAFKGMEDALVQFAQTGKLNFTDLANSIIADLIRIQVRQAITDPLGDILGTAVKFIGGSLFGGSEIVGADPVNTDVAHTGGVIGVDQLTKRLANAAMFDHAPRLHSGGIAGLKHNEVPAILQRGEGVFTQAQMRALQPANDTAPRVTVNIHNNAPVQVTQRESHTPDGGLQIDVMVEQVEGRIGENIANGDGLAPVLEGNYGLRKVGQ